MRDAQTEWQLDKVNEYLDEAAGEIQHAIAAAEGQVPLQVSYALEVVRSAIIAAAVVVYETTKSLAGEEELT